MPGNQAFDYIYNPDTSTWTRKWNGVDTLIETAHRDDTPNWTNTQKLNFNLGTMYLGDRWVANFTLKSLGYGLVRLFDGSYITSDDTPVSYITPSLVYVSPETKGTIPTEDLWINSYIVDNSLMNFYNISTAVTKRFM